jgi:hypothetical protein
MVRYDTKFEGWPTKGLTAALSHLSEGWHEKGHTSSQYLDALSVEGLLEPCLSLGRFTVRELFSEKRQQALRIGRTISRTPRTNRQEFLKLVTSLPPSDPRERELSLHLN